MECRGRALCSLGSSALLEPMAQVPASKKSSLINLTVVASSLGLCPCFSLKGRISLFGLTGSIPTLAGYCGLDAPGPLGWCLHDIDAHGFIDGTGDLCAQQPWLLAQGGIIPKGANVTVNIICCGT